MAALGHPVRIGILRELAASEGERTCGSLPMSVTKATATFHWRVLRESGVAREHKVGRYKAVELRREDLDTRFPGLLAAVLAATPPNARDGRNRAGERRGARVTGQTAKAAVGCECGGTAVRQVSQFVLRGELWWDSARLRLRGVPAGVGP
ncbi:ArsR/SmtB family transcription factor [Streptomyces avidinii]